MILNDDAIALLRAVPAAQREQLLRRFDLDSLHSLLNVLGCLARGDAGYAQFSRMNKTAMAKLIVARLEQ